MLTWSKIRMKILIPLFGSAYPNQPMFLFHISDWVLMMLLQILSLAGKQAFEKLNRISDKYCLEGYRKINEKRLYVSKYDNLEPAKKQKKLGAAKQKLRR